MKRMRPDEFEHKHPEAARYIRPGEDVRLFTIDEGDDNGEGEVFIATVEAVLDHAPPILRLVVKSESWEQLQPIIENLRDCAQARDCGLHIDVSSERMDAVGGKMVSSYSPGILLRPIVLDDPEHTFVPVHVGPVADDGTLLPGEYSLRFAVHMLD